MLDNSNPFGPKKPDFNPSQNNINLTQNQQYKPIEFKGVGQDLLNANIDSPVNFQDSISSKINGFRQSCDLPKVSAERASNAKNIVNSELPKQTETAKGLWGKLKNSDLGKMAGSLLKLGSKWMNASLRAIESGARNLGNQLDTAFVPKETEENIPQKTTKVENRISNPQDVPLSRRNQEVRPQQPNQREINIQNSSSQETRQTPNSQESFTSAFGNIELQKREGASLILKTLADFPGTTISLTINNKPFEISSYLDRYKIYVSEPDGKVVYLSNKEELFNLINTGLSVTDIQNKVEEINAMVNQKKIEKVNSELNGLNDNLTNLNEQKNKIGDDIKVLELMSNEEFPNPALKEAIKNYKSKFRDISNQINAINQQINTKKDELSKYEEFQTPTIYSNQNQPKNKPNQIESPNLTSNNSVNIPFVNNSTINTGQINGNITNEQQYQSVSAGNNSNIGIAGDFVAEGDSQVNIGSSNNINNGNVQQNINSGYQNTNTGNQFNQTFANNVSANGDIGINGVNMVGQQNVSR
jgi:hypothetical protein